MGFSLCGHDFTVRGNVGVGRIDSHDAPRLRELVAGRWAVIRWRQHLARERPTGERSGVFNAGDELFNITEGVGALVVHGPVSCVV